MWFKKVRTNVVDAVCDFADCECGDVAGAVHYRGHQFASRFFAVVVGNVYPTQWDWATYAGTIGLFLTLLFLFIRFLPMISISEMRVLVEEEAEEKEVVLGKNDELARWNSATREKIYGTDISSQHEHHRSREHLWRGVY